MMRALGAIPDTLDVVAEDIVKRPLSQLVGFAASVRAERDHSPFLDAIYDQGVTNSCVGWWLSNAIYLAGQIAGTPVERPSVRWLYSVARWWDTPNVLNDWGCRPRSALMGATEHGVISSSALPWAEEDVNDRVPLEVDVAAAVVTLTGWYRAAGGHIPTLLRLALDAGHIPGLALQVHDSFFQYTSGIYDEPAGTMHGHHMVTVVGYRPGAFLVANSWGNGWGEAGFAWLSDHFVESHYVSDRYVVTAVPAGR